MASTFQKPWCALGALGPAAPSRAALSAAKVGARRRRSEVPGAEEEERGAWLGLGPVLRLRLRVRAGVRVGVRFGVRVGVRARVGLRAGVGLKGRGPPESTMYLARPKASIAVEVLAVEVLAVEVLAVEVPSPWASSRRREAGEPSSRTWLGVG